MMLLKPSLLVEKLVVKSHGKIVYEECFHSGVNVLNGCNGGGKTSVIQLLVFGLGYEVPKWKDEAAQCDLVYVGVRFNGVPVTLRRINRQSDKQPMDICYKSIDDAMVSPVEEWSNYPYAITSARESFSQKIFSLLDIPEAKSDANGNNVTIHQILRLIYNDQSSPGASIFNLEMFDSAFKRESVGNYLLGLYDDEIYSNRIAMVVAEKKLESVISKLQAVHSVLGKTSFAKEFGSIDQARDAYKQKISEINLKILDVRQSALLNYVSEKGVAENSAVESVGLKNDLLECESAIQSLIYEIEDSKDFLAELIDKSRSIHDSIRVGMVVGDALFKYCPCCYAKLEPRPEGLCCLCGSDDSLGRSSVKLNLHRMKNEIDIQIKESERILAKKDSVLKELKDKKQQLRSSLRKTISKVTSTITSVNSKGESEVYSLYREIGEFEERIANLDRVAELHRSLAELSASRDAYQSEFNRLRDSIQLKQSQFFLREPEIKEIISRHLIAILRADVGAEKEFKNASVVEFEFASNTISVNGKSAFSESGMFYLNNAFHLSLLLASLEKEYVRIPRFMILDGIENGGMEDVRSRNFQKIMRDFLSVYSVGYQLIYATKSIAPELDSSDYIVGQKFTESCKSLKGFS